MHTITIEARRILADDTVEACCPKCGSDLVIELPSTSELIKRHLADSPVIDLGLSKTELVIFDALRSAHGRPISYDGLLDIVWRGFASKNALKTHLSHMRRKLAGSIWSIDTERGYGGYRLLTQEAA